MLLRLAEVDCAPATSMRPNATSQEPAEVFLDGGDTWGSAQVLAAQALVAAIRGREEESRRLVQEAISLERGHGVKQKAIANRWVLGFLELSLGQPGARTSCSAPCPTLWRRPGCASRGLFPYCLTWSRCSWC